MATFVPCKKNDAAGYIFYIGLVSQANPNICQVNPTIAAGDFQVSIDGAALANLGTLPAVTPAASKMVKITLAQAEINGDNITVVCSDAAGAEWCDQVINIQTAARFLDDHCFPTTSGRSLDVTATGAAGIDWGNVENPTTALNLSATNIDVDQVVASVSGAVGSVTGAVGSIGAGGIATTSFAAGAIDAAAIAASALGTSEVAAAVDARIVDAVWDELRSGHTTQASYGENQAAVISGSAITGTLSTTQMTTDLTNATNDSMNGRTVIFKGNVTAALAGQATNITAYVGASKLVTYTAITTAPANGDLFIIV